MMHTSNTAISITDCNFMNNSALDGGGVLYMWDTMNTTITITDCE